jgi:hypothetical protein
VARPGGDVVGHDPKEQRNTTIEKSLCINKQKVGIVPRFVGKTPSGKKAFIALGLTAGSKTAAIRRRRTRAVVLQSTETALGSHACVALSSVPASRY